MPLVGVCVLGGGCAASFGPGYSVNTQTVDVRFTPGPPPHISIDAQYEVSNTGTQPLSSLELRLPGRRRFKSSDVSLEWDGQELRVEQSAANPRNSLVMLPSSWAMLGRHSVHVKMDLQTSTEGEIAPRFRARRFFSAGARVGSGVAAGARAICHRRRAPCEMGPDSSRAKGICYPYERRQNQDFKA